MARLSEAYRTLAVSDHYHPGLAHTMGWIGLVMALLILFSRPRHNVAPSAAFGILLIAVIVDLLLAIYFSR